MQNVKQQVIQMIQNLPEDVSVEDIMEELYFKLQVDAGLKELDEGKGIPQEEVEKRILEKLKYLPEDKLKEVLKEVFDFIGYLINKEKERIWRKDLLMLLNKMNLYGKKKKITQKDIEKSIKEVRNQQIV